MKWTTMVPDVRSLSGTKEDAGHSAAHTGGASSSDRQSPGAISGVERLSPKLTSRSAQTEIPPDGYSLPGELLPPHLQVCYRYWALGVVCIALYCIAIRN